MAAAWSALVLTASPANAVADVSRPQRAGVTRLAPGVVYETFSLPASHGTAHGHLLTVDLDNDHVRVDLLRPGAADARAPVSRLADARGAVAAVNGDFFNISESQHPGVDPTFSAVGPAIAGGRQLKAAVPDGQRFGPALVPGTTAEDVLGIGADHVARLDRLTLQGVIVTKAGASALDGLNEYALPVDGVGAYTPAWGPASRLRATCGTDTDRGAACSADTYEVTVHGDTVTAVSAAPGKGAIPRGSVVLVGREAGAQTLRHLRPGDRVHIRHRLQGTGDDPLAFAVGGYPILRDGVPLDGLNETVAATRTAAGIGDDGHRLYLLALDGGTESGAGLTLGELARLLLGLGAEHAVDLDGGGSSTLVTRTPGSTHSTVRNHPTGVAERPVPNGVGVLLTP
ncbi:phosphodiester glycosidase family protein [Streptomyces sp. H10-C2]|uniref:phosphodiester glycosidase family protein n=1 Tax=unclassified Streptomyces TaxID=2593676 RepID=UPI0024B96F42|nr:MULTISPECIES: phosphodiester glycosidase family protein [unclassified Streptomyces]MDJ0344059.1 phosphodiester glycosidase family protein [Streptomyces sp. PH10-H1]MDJ0368598.1 phosphodiester glycosidase family protein [Streptomyces sp. H10-C2]